MTLIDIIDINLLNRFLTNLKNLFYTGDEVDTLLESKANSNDLATVATSGSYNDLTDTPTIPAAVTESTVSGWGFTKNTGNVSSISVTNIVTLTEAQYEALSTKDSSTLYIITSS